MITLSKTFFQIPASCLRPDEIIDFSSKSSCELRGSCCEGGDLACHGCNPVLLSKGIPCEQQTTDREKANARDCFCDKSCILFQARISNQVKSCNPMTFDDLKLTLIDLD